MAVDVSCSSAQLTCHPPLYLTCDASSAGAETTDDPTQSAANSAKAAKKARQKAAAAGKASGDVPASEAVADATNGTAANAAQTEPDNNTEDPRTVEDPAEVCRVIVKVSCFVFWLSSISNCQLFDPSASRCEP